MCLKLPWFWRLKRRKKIRWCTIRKKMFLVVMNVYQENHRSIAKGGWMQKLDLVPGAMHNFVCCLFSYILFIYNNTLGICLCFKAKGHGTRMTSEQSLKWWGFLQDGVLCSLSYHELYLPITLYPFLTECALISDKNLIKLKITFLTTKYLFHFTVII